MAPNLIYCNENQQFNVTKLFVNCQRQRPRVGRHGLQMYLRGTFSTWLPPSLKNSSLCFIFHLFFKRPLCLPLLGPRTLSSSSSCKYINQGLMNANREWKYSWIHIHSEIQTDNLHLMKRNFYISGFEWVLRERSSRRRLRTLQTK